MALEQRRRRETVSTRRLEAYTDGVFAIAATLLVLDLSIGGFGAINSDKRLWDALTGIGDNLLSFVISFLLLCLLWTVHTRQFEHVRHVDSVVLILNSLRLLAVVLIPFTTSINSAYNSLPLGRLLMPANFFVVVLLGSVQWFYLTTPGRGLLEGISDEQIRAGRWGSLTAVMVAAVVAVLAPLIGSWAFAFFALNSFIEALLARVDARNRRAKPTKAAD